jgi:2-iminoacetate synthase ThiH
MSFSLTARSGERFSQTIADTTDGKQISRPGVCLLIAAQEEEKISELMRAASCLRDRAKGNTISFSKKVFIPLTNICRDRCRYCAFRKDPGEPGAKIMTPFSIVA